MKCNVLYKVLYYDIVIVPMVSANIQLWRVMALMDLCLHDSVKLQYPTCGKSVQPLQSVKFIRIVVSAVSDGL
jgi:hypothetical protein